MEEDESARGPIFPYELEQLIFTVAVESYPASANNFMLVAHRVHEWVAHIVYRVCTQISAPYYFPDTRKPVAPSVHYFGPFVKHLMIGGEAKYGDIKLFLESCPNVIDLALWTSHPTKIFIRVLENLRLQRLSTKLSTLDAEDLKKPCFSSVTHLDVTRFAEELEGWKVLENLPALTHLAINDFVDQETVQYLLDHCAKLKILLVIQAAPDKLNMKLDGAEIDDPRFVMMDIQRFVVEDWESGTKGEEDIWTCADIISAAKHRGSFRMSDFCTWFSRYHWREQLDALEKAYSVTRDCSTYPKQTN